MRIEVKKDIAKAIAEAMRDLTKSEVLIGIPDTNAPRSNDEDEARKASGEPINNAEIGYVHEFGVPEKNIPARPFLIPGIDAAKKRVASILANGAKKALGGDKDAVDQALTKAGIVGEISVKNRIDEGPFVPLSPRTLAERRRRGRTGTKPLIDTGQLLKSVTSVVRPKGK